MKKFLFITIFVLTNLSSSAASKCVAHRGNNIEELENSLAALKSAMDINSDGIEFDIRHSSDGVPYLIHDDTLERVASKLQKGCSVKDPFNTLTSDHIDRFCLLSNDEKVPRLEDALELLNEYHGDVFLEFKDEPTLTDVQLIQKYLARRAKNLYIISFKKEYLEKFEHWKSFYSYLKLAKLLKLNKYGRKDWKKFDGVDSNLLFNFMIRSLKKKGKVVGVWTKDKKSQMKKYFKKGVHFITTNNPKLCLEVKQLIH